MIKLVLDCEGGDRSPSVNVLGAVKALKEKDDLSLILTGKKEDLENELSKLDYPKDRLTIVDAPEVIDCKEAPTLSLFHKRDSSLVKALDILKNDDDVKGFVSLGNSGAILVGGVVKVGKIPGVLRPAFCPLMPSMDGHYVAVCDSGASSEATKEELFQFGLMGSLYLEKAFDVKSPRVALLNIGTEEAKGDTLHKEAYQLLKGSSLNFIGNMEARDTLSGKYDLIVADGFSGNVLIKSTEGTGLEMLKLLKRTFFKNLKNKIGALFLKKDIYGIKDFMDYNNYGGAVTLGVKKTMVKGHGGDNEKHFYHCIIQAYNMEKNNLGPAIEEALK